MKGYRRILIRCAAVVAILALVVEPMVWRGMLRVDAPDAMSTANLRLEPALPTLRKVAHYSLQDIPVPVGIDAIAMADRLLGQQDFIQGFSGAPYALPFSEKARQSDLVLRRHSWANGRAPVTYSMPFAERDMLRHDGIGGLPYASLYLVDVMLDAYVYSSDEKYIAAARDMILAFSRFEQSRWIQAGYLWNDHAIGTRAGVLARFWSIYRTHRIYADADATHLLLQVARTAALLASPRDFNVRTNHGVMQNVALLQLLLAFPGLHNAASYWQVARSRLQAQVSFLYAEDGFVLEHSAHYHEVGVRLLGMATHLLEIAGEPLPNNWESRLSGATARLADITRPDGTLPAFGDTEVEFWADRHAEPKLHSRPNEFQVMPLSGYAIISFGGSDPSHTTAVWSDFSGHGHKLADEMSLLIWAQGRGLLTNSGYWDYGGWGRPFTEGWLGSNAPHWVNEAARAARKTRVLATANSAGSGYLELERSNVDGRRFEREILVLNNGVWLVIDHAHGGAADQAETVWTFFPDMQLAQTQDGIYTLRDANDRQLLVSVRSTSPLRVEKHNGSRSPFAGWITVGREGVPAPALRVLTTGASSTTATLFGTTETVAQSFTFESTKGGGWKARGVGWSAERENTQLRLETAGAGETLALGVPPDVGAQRTAIAENYTQALSRYPREPNLDRYRRLLIELLLTLFVLQELFFFLLAKSQRFSSVRARSFSLSVVAALLWIASGLWLHLHYLRV